MAKFTYIVKDSTGKTIADSMEAASQDAVVRRLQNEGYFIVDIQETTQITEKSPKRRKLKAVRIFESEKQP